MNNLERLLPDNNLPSTDRDGPRSNPYRPTEITRDGENAVVNLNVWYAENKRAWDKEWQDYIDGCFHAG